MKSAAITLVELPPTAFGSLKGAPVEDAYSTCRFPSRAIPLLHSILAREGFTNIRSINPAFNGDGGRLNAANLRRIIASDYLLLSAITRTIPQTSELALHYKKHNPGGTVVVGGPHATYLPEECLEWADVVVRKEGDKTLPRLIEALVEKGVPDGVRGISYRKNGRIVHEEDVEPLTEEELSNLPVPYFDKATLKQMRVWPICTSRGCPFKCDYCSVWRLYGTCYRRRSNESILRELEAARNDSAKFIFFIDDNFSGRPAETKELLRIMIERGLNKKPLMYQLSIYAAFDEELLSLLKKAGGYSVFLGIESISDETLKALNKKVDARKNKSAVKLFRRAGFWVNAMMMIGGDGDTEESLRETALWAKDNLDSVQYFTPTPLPGTIFAEEMKSAGRVLAENYYLYDGNHVLIRPKNFTPCRLQKLIFDMYREFYSLRKVFRNFTRSVYPFKKIVIYAYAKKCIKSWTNNPESLEYIKRLKAMN